MIKIESPSQTVAACETVIVVPERAVDEAGYIQTYSIKDSGHAKHEYHALAQMAYFQLQDDELDIREAERPLTVRADAGTIELDGGMIVCRGAGEVYALVQSGQNRKKLLEAAYRWCTRWVRLDI